MNPLIKQTKKLIKMCCKCNEVDDCAIYEIRLGGWLCPTCKAISPVSKTGGELCI